MYLYNARIYTMDSEKPSASAIAIDDGKIKAVGSDQEIIAKFQDCMHGIDLKGKVVLPGLTDAHIHLEHYALGLQKVNCETSTKEECLKNVAAAVGNQKPGEWILGHGWNQNQWEDGFGSRADLDQVAPHNPVYLTAKSLHAGWVNSAALKLARLDEGSPDPANGMLGRDQDGRLSGILFESAMDLVSSVLPEVSAEDLSNVIGSAQVVLWKMGITGVHDFDRKRCFQALQLLREKGELRLRVLKSIPLEDLSHVTEVGLRSGFGDDWIRIGSVKVFADGALGPQTAAMMQPYGGSSDGVGNLFLDAEELFEYGKTAAEGGLPLAIHAIGDRANHVVLDGLTHLRDYERQRPELRLNRLRHRIEHVQLIHPNDARRLAELGVIASMQPIHATSDMLMADRYWGDRARYAYAWNLLLKNHTQLAFGSDAPVEPPNPFLGIYAAITRRRLDGSPSTDGWQPEQKITVKQAVEAYTVGAAYAAGWEDKLGMIRPGYLADIIVLEEDPFTCLPEDIPELKPSAVMVGGDWVLQS